MFAKYILLDPVEHELRSIDQVWDALDRLDGDSCSILIVAERPPIPGVSEVPFSGRAIAIAGGAQDQFLCEAFEDGETEPIRIRNPDVPKSHAESVLLRRGELEEFDRHWIVGRPIVERALKAFAECGELDKDLIWERL